MKKLLFWLLLLIINAFVVVSCSVLSHYDDAELVSAWREHYNDPTPETLLLKRAQGKAGTIVLGFWVISLLVLILGNIAMLKGARRIRSMLRNRRRMAQLKESSDPKKNQSLPME